MKKQYSRRDFLKNSLALLGASSLLPAFPSYATSSDVLLRTETVYIPRLPKSFDGFRIGLLSDLHLGPWVSPDLVSQAVRLINSEKPDLILLAGDFVGIPDQFPVADLPYSSDPIFDSISKADLPQKIFTLAADLFSELKAPQGVFAVYGNHDNWIEPTLCAAAFANKKIPILKNDLIRITRNGDELTLIGCDDYWSGIPVWPKQIARRAKNQARLLLTHNPDYVSYLLDSTNANFDLALCGHTHGGQIRLPLVGALTYNVEDRRFADGLAKHPRGQVFTSRGVGVVEVPFRLNCPSEVNMIMLSVR